MKRSYIEAGFEETGDIGVMRLRGRKQIANETAETFALSKESPVRSFPWSTIRKIVRSSLKCYPYKISFVRQLNPADLEKSLNFVINFLIRMLFDNEWPLNILWPEEAHFTLNGAVNSQN